MKTVRAFTLLELLVTIAVIAILAGLSLAGIRKVRSVGQSAACANSLRQLGAAAHMYLSENDQKFFAYSQPAPEGTMWYFGLERGGGPGGEGDRELDQTAGPLYPYIKHVNGIQSCPAFPFGSALAKPKFKGASWGYGFNTSLSNASAARIELPARIILFGDCAQVNTFQAPASSNNPMIEEFYMIDVANRTIHFRHGTSANMLFLDGHVEGMKLYPGTQDTRIKSEKIGRMTPLGSTEYLK